MGLRPGYKQTEVGVIPADWNVRLAGSVGRFRGGNGFPLTFQGKGAGDYPFFKVSDMNNEGNETEMVAANNYISNSVRKLLGATAFPARTIVFAKVGAAVFLERKKLLVAPSCIDNNMAGFIIEADDIDHRFIHHFLLSYRLSSLVATTALPSLSGSVLRAIQLPLPPTRHEQKAIAEALSNAGALIESLEQLLAKKRQIKQGAMQNLLTGNERLPGFSDKWDWKRLGELVSIIPSGIYGSERPTGSSVGMPVATTAHIARNDSWNDREMDVRYFTTDQIATYLPQEGDLVVVKSSGSAASIQSGKIGYVSQDKSGAFIFSNFLMLLRPNAVQARFLYFQLVSDRVKRMLPQLVEASTYPNIRIPDYLEIQIPVPDRGEQDAIAFTLCDMDAELSSLEAKLTKARQLKQGMMQVLLTGQIRLPLDVAA